jgi:hypothetical protein
MTFKAIILISKMPSSLTISKYSYTFAKKKFNV